MPPTWSRLLDNANSVNEVVSIARDHFAMWTPEELGHLPAACRPPHLRDAIDLENLNRAAVEAFRATRASGQAMELLQKLTGFVGRACVRIAQLGDEDGAMPSEPSRAREKSASPRSS